MFYIVLGRVGIAWISPRCVACRSQRHVSNAQHVKRPQDTERAAQRMTTFDANQRTNLSVFMSLVDVCNREKPEKLLKRCKRRLNGDYLHEPNSSSRVQLHRNVYRESSESTHNSFLHARWILIHYSFFCFLGFYPMQRIFVPRLYANINSSLVCFCVFCFVTQMRLKLRASELSTVEDAENRFIKQWSCASMRLYIKAWNKRSSTNAEFIESRKLLTTIDGHQRQRIYSFSDELPLDTASELWSVLIKLWRNANSFNWKHKLLITINRGTFCHLRRVAVGESLNHINLLQRNLYSVLVLSFTGNISSPEL